MVHFCYLSVATLTLQGVICLALPRVQIRATPQDIQVAPAKMAATGTH